MDTIALIYASLVQERAELEHALTKIINFPSNHLTQINDSKKILKKIAEINGSLMLLDSMLKEPEGEKE